MAKIKLEIISPNKVVYSADIDMLIVRSIAGDLGIMPKHAPLLAGLLVRRRVRRAAARTA